MIRLSMNTPFNADEAKKFLQEKEKRERDEHEAQRKQVLEKLTAFLKQEFQSSTVEVYLVGSLTRPYQFSSRSDVDIVLKNFHGDRFDLMPRIETLTGRSVEIILYEQSPFQQEIDRNGLKVL